MRKEERLVWATVPDIKTAEKLAVQNQCVLYFDSDAGKWGIFNQLIRPDRYIDEPALLELSVKEFVEHWLK